MSNGAKKRGRPKGAKSDNLTQEFKNAVAAMSTEELKERVVTVSQYEEEVKTSMRNDVALQDAKELAKDLSAPYRETLKTLGAQRSYVVLTLEERGQPVKPA